MIEVHELTGLATAETWGARRLTFDEVLAAGRPAVYHRFGDHLLYVQGRLFDVHEPASPVDVGPASLGPGLHVDRAMTVGIEYGWRHSADCGCSFCDEAA